MSVVAVPGGVRCCCLCHRASTIGPYTGVAVTDPVEAVTACAGCLRDHVAALLERRIWDETTPREIVPWVDPPPDRTSGDSRDTLPDPSEGPET